MRWLITGGCGFIGKNLVRTLLDEGGHRIRVLDNLSAGTRADLGEICGFIETDAVACDGVATLEPDAVELVVGDVLEEALNPRAFADAETVVHLASGTDVAQSVADPLLDCRTNVIGTLNCLEMARDAGVGRFVFASSGAPVGAEEPPIHEDMPARPISPHAAGKLAGEGYCSAYFRSFGMETVVLRFGNAYGPGSGHKTSVVSKFIRSAISGEILEIYGDGGQTRDFIYIDDLVRAIRLSAISAGVGGEILQIGTGQETMVGGLLDKLLATLAISGVRETRLRHIAPRTGDARRNYVDASKAERLLGWKAEVGLSDGLKRTIAWFLEREGIASAAE